MSLEDDLQEIHGVGPETAAEIMEIVNAQNMSPEIEADVREAWDYYQNGDYSYMGKFLERAVNNLD